MLLKSAYSGTKFNIYGSNYNTSDGNCVRDYLHICDLAKSHYLALKYLDTGRTLIDLDKDAKAMTYKTNSARCIFDGFNLGTSSGYSVRQVINCTEKVTSKKIDVIEVSRRQGDPPKLVADATKAEYVLGWRQPMSSLENILQSANEFYIKNQQ